MGGSPGIRNKQKSTKTGHSPLLGFGSAKENILENITIFIANLQVSVIITLSATFF